MMKSALVITLFLAACAGQYRYRGPNDQVIITERVLTMPEAPLGFGGASGNNVKGYWEQSVHKVVEIGNGTDQRVTMTLMCHSSDLYGEKVITLDPHQAQQVLVTTTAKYAYEKICGGF